MNASHVPGRANDVGKTHTKIWPSTWWNIVRTVHSLVGIK